MNEGAVVVLGDIDVDALDAATVRLRRIGRIHGVPGDVAKMADGARMVAEAVAFGGQLDILFCNAGIPARRSIEDLTEDEWDQVMAVNLKGMFTVIKAAVPAMRHAGGGTIVLTGSELSFVGDPEAPA